MNSPSFVLPSLLIAFATNELAVHPMNLGQRLQAIDPGLSSDLPEHAPHLRRLPERPKADLRKSGLVLPQHPGPRRQDHRREALAQALHRQSCGEAVAGDGTGHGDRREQARQLPIGRAVVEVCGESDGRVQGDHRPLASQGA